MGIKIQLSKYLFSFVFAFFTTFISCTEIDEEEPVILTEGVLFLSGERVRLSGRIYSNSGSEVSEHGFEISMNENFANPILIQNGTRSTLGAFIGEFSELNSDIDYYYRAFAIIDKVLIYGSKKSFLTLNSSLSSFSPNLAYSGDKVKIIGANFSSKTRVFFGDIEVDILSIDLESIIEVRVPEIGSSTQVIIKVTEGVSEIMFDEPFEYIFGTWNQVMEFPDDLRFFESVGLTTEEHFVFGLGRNHNGSEMNNTLWDYDFALDTWTQLPFIGATVRGAFYNNGGYFGAGAIEWQFQTVPTMSNEFWKYENGAIKFIGQLPFVLYKAISFYYQNAVFVTGGFDIEGNESFKTFMYSELNDTWITLENAPVIIANDLPNFTHNNLQYFLTEEGEMWTMNLDTRVWNKVDDVPFFVRTDGVAQVIGDKAYIGICSNSRTNWEYDILNDSWKEKMKFAGDVSYRNTGSFVKDSFLRVIRLNPSGTIQERMQIWEFDPMAF